jgi:thiamine-monophosphate kinase
VARGLDPRSLGEFGLIEAIRRRAPRAGGVWVRGIGDDAAVLRPRAGRELVLTTDTLAEDVHFRWSTTDASSLGRKALAVNLSDLGAMGARPLGCLLNLGLPKAARPGCVEGVLGGLLAEARAAACPLVGGDTVAARHWVLSVTAIGDVPRGKALRRDTAHRGDRLMVTGELGSSALGLVLLQTDGGTVPGSRRFVRRQLCPRPPYQVGSRLARGQLASAAIDLSDGMAADLGHLLRESGLAADVHLDRLPFARGMRALCRRLGLDPDELALHGGEDYELLFCVPADAPSAAVYARRLRCRVTEVGVLRAGRGARYLRDGQAVSVKPQGFDHFKPLSDGSDK